MADAKLKEYRQRRNLKVSGEPRGTIKKSKKMHKPIFVIQKHAARSLHYDFRLEIDGVLKSWAVPKGPSTDPKQKHLAVPTDDHPMEYATFEGIIPEGEYGAGEVIVWDTGTFENIKEIDGKSVPLKECYARGTIEVFLHGKKLQGGYALIRTELEHEGKPKWLLIKMRDEYADARRNPVKTQPESVLSGKTIKDLKKSKRDSVKKKAKKK
jgi:DNA ligase D-like protein (predicted 3'-phosphoesterase)